MAAQQGNTGPKEDLKPTEQTPNPGASCPSFGTLPPKDLDGSTPPALLLTTDISLELVALPVWSFPWQMSHSSGTRNIFLRSPLPNSFQLHRFMKWPFRASWPVRAFFMQGRPCFQVPGLSSSLKPERRYWILPHSWISQASKGSTKWMKLTSLAANLGWTPACFIHVKAFLFCGFLVEDPYSNFLSQVRD